MKNLWIFILMLFFVPAGHAAVIFETNLDGSTNWNTDASRNGDECSVIGASASANVCPSGNYPTGWEAYRSVPFNLDGWTGAMTDPAISIGPLPGGVVDHTTGTFSGKAIVVYNESARGDCYDQTFGCGVSWPCDSILVKYFGGTSYPELYVQFWMRTQAGWHWGNGLQGNTAQPQIKLFRTGTWLGLSTPNQNIFEWVDAHPNQVMDLYYYGGNQDGIAHAYRCDPSDYFCVNQNNSYEKTDFPYAIGGYPYSDGNWHRFKYHVKLNTVGSYDGTMEMYLDGHLVYSHYDVMWRESGSTAPGLTYVALGGNSNNSWLPIGEIGDQWYAMDDVVISTTDIADDYVPGGSTPPSAVIPTAKSGGTMAGGSAR